MNGDIRYMKLIYRDGQCLSSLRQDGGRGGLLAAQPARGPCVQRVAPLRQEEGDRPERRAGALRRALPDARAGWTIVVGRSPLGAGGDPRRLRPGSALSRDVGRGAGQGHAPVDQRRRRGRIDRHGGTSGGGDSLGGAGLGGWRRLLAGVGDEGGWQAASVRSAAL